MEAGAYRAKPGDPIGVFDSGIGGLTVLKELARQLPHEHFIYLGDLAHSPYGSKSPEAVRGFSLQIARYLLSRQVKLIVIACNTASAAAALEVSQLAGPVPVMEVVEAGAVAALDAVAHLREPARIGILGTETTVASCIYARKLEAMAQSRGMARPALMQTACPLFVPLVEEGFWDGSIPRQVAKYYLSAMRSFRPHTVILGCTHYPLLEKAIRRALPAALLAQSAPVLVSRVEAYLDRQGFRAPSESPGKLEFYTSDSVDTFSRHAGRFLDLPGLLVHHIDLDACAGGEE